MKYGGHVSLKRFFGINAIPGSRGRSADESRPYLPELTGLRGIAILIVVFGHLLQRIERFYVSDTPPTHLMRAAFTLLATPFTGCCLLFCISGYLLFHNLNLVPINAVIQKSTLDFTLRRIFRLGPPYYILLITTFLTLETTGYVVSGTNQFFVEPSSLLTSLLASLTFSHDLVFGTFPRLFPPGWFIETQVQFYLIGPVVWTLYLKIAAGPRRLVFGVLALIVSFVISLLILDRGPQDLRYSLLAFFPYFWIGAVVADLQTQYRGHRLHCLLQRNWQIGWCSLVVLIILGGEIQNSALVLGARIVALSVILLTAFIDGSGLQRALTNRSLTRIGIASYSIYLVHLQVFQLFIPIIVRIIDDPSIVPVIVASVVFGLPAAMACSVLFFWLVERPSVIAARLLAAKSGAVWGRGPWARRCEGG